MILLTRQGGVHGSQLSLAVPPAPSTRNVFSFVAWTGILWWIFWEPKSNMTDSIKNNNDAYQSVDAHVVRTGLGLGLGLGPGSDD